MNHSVNAANIGANIGQGIVNNRASGLFVYVKDVDHPVWRVEIFKTAEQARWMEILTQCKDEGLAPRRPESNIGHDGGAGGVAQASP